MFLPRLAALITCATVGLGAQVAVDLNSLTAAAARFASKGFQGQQHGQSLDLHLMRGDNGGNTSWLMTRSADVQRWTLFYDINYENAPANAQTDIVLPAPRSASLKCCRGVFSDFFTSQPPIPNCKSMESTWMALSLDAAIAHLNTQGYQRGFSKVEVKRPDAPGIPGELVYVFTCPWERANVAISASTGAMVWLQMF